MRVKLQLVICDEDGHEETVTDIVTLRKDSQRIEHPGLTLLRNGVLPTPICRSPFSERLFRPIQLSHKTPIFETSLCVTAVYKYRYINQL